MTNNNAIRSLKNLLKVGTHTDYDPTTGKIRKVIEYQDYVSGYMLLCQRIYTDKPILLSTPPDIIPSGRLASNPIIQNKDSFLKQGGWEFLKETIYRPSLTLKTPGEVEQLPKEQYDVVLLLLTSSASVVAETNIDGSVLCQDRYVIRLHKKPIFHYGRLFAYDAHEIRELAMRTEEPPLDLDKLEGGNVEMPGNKKRKKKAKKAIKKLVTSILDESF